MVICATKMKSGSWVVIYRCDSSTFRPPQIIVFREYIYTYTWLMKNCNNTMLSRIIIFISVALAYHVVLKLFQADVRTFLSHGEIISHLKWYYEFLVKVFLRNGRSHVSIGITLDTLLWVKQRLNTVCKHRFYGVYNCYSLVRHFSGYITVSVSAYGTCRILDCWIWKRMKAASYDTWSKSSADKQWVHDSIKNIGIRASTFSDITCHTESDFAFVAVVHASSFCEAKDTQLWIYK